MALDHTLTVQEALTALGGHEITVASQSIAGRNAKGLTYVPSTQTWKTYLRGELLVESHQPFPAVESYNNAR